MHGILFNELKNMTDQCAEDSFGDEDEDAEVQGRLMGLIKLNDTVVLRGNQPIYDFTREAF